MTFRGSLNKYSTFKIEKLKEHKRIGIALALNVRNLILMIKAGRKSKSG
jgi:hypothetical protein